MGIVGLGRPAAPRDDREVPARPERPGDHRGRPRRRAGLGRGRDGAASAAGVPVGYYKDAEKTRAHVPRHRRRALLDPRRLRHRRGRRHASGCSAAARCASTPAARRSSPRRSRRRSRRHPDGARRGGRRRARREVGRGDHRARRAARRRDGVDDADAHRPREGRAAGVQGAEAGRSSRPRSAGRRTARSTTRRAVPGLPSSSASADRRRPTRRKDARARGWRVDCLPAAPLATRICYGLS